MKGLPPREWMLWAWPKLYPTKYPQDRRTISYHEAGHAVLCRVMEVPFDSAHVHDTVGADRIAGEVCLGEYPERNHNVTPEGTAREDAAVGLVAVYLAGTMAELKLHKIEVHGWLGLDTPDFQFSRAVLRKVFGHDMPLYYCQCVTTAILTKFWPWVSAVAAELEAKGSVSAGEIDRLYPVKELDG